MATVKKQLLKPPVPWVSRTTAPKQCRKTSWNTSKPCKKGKSADDRRRHQRRARFGAGRRIRRRSGRTDIARDGADIVLLNEDLRTVAHLLDQARRTRHIIRQNLIWAGAYNIIAVPLAVLGYVNRG